MIDIYNKIAISVVAAIDKAELGSNFAVLVTSSNKALDTLDVAQKLSSSIISLEKKCVFKDISSTKIKSLDEAKALVTELCKDGNCAVISANSLCDNEAAMLIAAAAKNTVLVEKRKSSRKDIIDEAILSLKSLNSTPLGFILL